MTTPSIINHLWQSSCYVLLAGLLAFVLRKNSAKIRYWVWLSASLKFLIPFALLVSLGSVVTRPDRHPVSVAAPVFPNTIVQIAQPFSTAPGATVPVSIQLDRVPVAIGVVWALGFLAITLARCRSWLGVQAALRADTPIELAIPVRALITPGAEEPGIVGFLRLVLVLPAQLLEHLTPPQLGAILTHEMCHVRRRDNFFAAVHMVVEAIFWFHPLVWWIGSRLVEERELACDEEVLANGLRADGLRSRDIEGLPLLHGIPATVYFRSDGRGYQEASTGDSRGRHCPRAERRKKKLTLAMIGLAALAVPILIGVLNAPAIRAQNTPAATPRFEVASIEPTGARREAWIRPVPGGSPRGRGCGISCRPHTMCRISRSWVARSG